MIFGLHLFQFWKAMNDVRNLMYLLLVISLFFASFSNQSLTSMLVQLGKRHIFPVIILAKATNN